MEHLAGGPEPLSISPVLRKSYCRKNRVNSVISNYILARILGAETLIRRRPSRPYKTSSGGLNPHRAKIYCLLDLVSARRVRSAVLVTASLR